MTIHQFLDQLRADSVSDAELGGRFERLMLAYLRTDPMWFSRFSNVWLWDDWPGREGEVDTGIDLVCEQRDGSGFTAVQCKCYCGHHDPRHEGPRDILHSLWQTAVHRADDHRDHKPLDQAPSARHRGQDKPTIRVTVGDLEASSIDWSQWDAGQSTLGRKPRKTPYPHQRDAILYMENCVRRSFGTLSANLRLSGRSQLDAPDTVDKERQNPSHSMPSPFGP